MFYKVGILKNQQKSSQLDDRNPSKSDQKIGDFYPPATTVEDVISADKNVMTPVPFLTDEEAMNVVNADDVDNETDEDDATFDPVYPKVSDVWEGLQVLHDYMQFSISGTDIQQKLNALSFK